MSKANGEKKSPRRHGKPPFVPTDDQRRLVAGMASVRMSQEEMRQILWNPHTGKPLTKSTLIKHFRRELTEGASKLRAVLGQRWLDLIYSKDDRVAWHAVEFGLKYICGYRDDAPMVNMAVQQNGSIDGAFKIEFVNAPRMNELGAKEIDPPGWNSRSQQVRPLPALTLDNNSKPTTVHPFDDSRQVDHVSVWDRGSDKGWMK
jgi:hypothetical protein